MLGQEKDCTEHGLKTHATLNMQVLMNTGGVAMTNAFLVADEDAKVAVLFDAPDSTTLPLIEQAKSRGWEIIGLWLTHGHFDHTADHAIVTSHFPNANVLIHKLDEPKLQHPAVQTRMFALPFTIPPRSADAYVEDGQELALGSMRVNVLHTPGHAPGHVMYHFPEHELLVGGDLIIAGSVGRTDLPDSSHADLQASIRRVMKLPPATRLLPGHGQPSTLREEMETNPFVQEATRG
jgi:hydroxyacylglutathione hydrolase